MTTFVLRRNEALNPAVINPASGGADGWTTNRGFGGGAGTYSYGTATGIPSPAGLVTFRRKQWTANGTGPGSAGFQVYATSTTYHPVTAGDTICVSACMRMIGSASTPKNFCVRMQCWDRTAVSGAVAVGGTVVGAVVRAETYNVWYRVSLGMLVPAGAKGVAIYIDTATTNDPPFMNGDGLDCTELLIERGGVVGTYFSGATPAAGGKSYRWTGAANASSSEQTGTALPVPVSTDLMADAAGHIRNFAEAVESALAAPMVVRTFDSGEDMCSGNGYVNASMSSDMASVTGCVVGPVDLIDHAYNGDISTTGIDRVYRPVPVRDPSNGPLSFRCFNPPSNTVNAGKYQRLVGVAWGPPAGAVTSGPAPAGVPPGATFPAGVTAHGIRYPGTDEPQWRTAEAVQQMADDIGAALGGQPLGVTLAMWRGTLNLTDPSNVTYRSVERDFKSQLAMVRGAVATYWDSASRPLSLTFSWVPWTSTQNDSRKSVVMFYVTDNELSKPASELPPEAKYPGAPPSSVTSVGVNIIAWGDPA